jgi:N-acetylglucosaminyldiphosphoundecaprenol N-acetyl-beta-D-mannosaminyltransferase
MNGKLDLPGVRGRRVFGIEFSLWNRKQLVDAVSQTEVGPGSGVHLVVTTNVDHIVKLRRNARFREAYRHVWIATADGAPVFLYARLRGVRIPQRIVGGDVFPEIFDALSPAKHRPFFVAAEPMTGSKLKHRLEMRGFLPSQIGIEVPPFGFEHDDSYGDRLASRIRQLPATHLFFGVGAPKSEIWIHQYRDKLGDLYAFGFGSALDFLAGTYRRAPRLMRRMGLEGLWRVMGEPRRLSKRYFVESWAFPAAILDDLRSGGKRLLRIEEEPPR